MRNRLLAATLVLVATGCGPHDGSDGSTACAGVNCTVNLAVDDEIGSVCAVKTDGRYRCFGVFPPLPELPADLYTWVQAGRQGPIGLTSDGRIVAIGTHVPAGLPPVIELSTTNMWHAQGLCYRTSADGPLYVFSDRPLEPGLSASSLTDVYEGPFRNTTCAFEGLAAGVRADGTAWVEPSGLPKPAGSNWRQLAIGKWIFCGVTNDGAVGCVRLSESAGRCTGGQAVCSDSDPLPTFPVDHYVQVAATYKVACALTAAGALACSRPDGAAVPAPAGRYTFIDAGRDVLCALRPDGTTACWQHDTDPMSDDLAVTRFDPIAIDPAW